MACSCICRYPHMIYIHTDTKSDLLRKRKESQGESGNPRSHQLGPGSCTRVHWWQCIQGEKSQMEVGTGGTRVCRREGWGLQNGCKTHRPLVSEQTEWCWYGTYITLSWLVPIPQVLELSAAYLNMFPQHSSVYHRAVGVTMVLSKVAGGRLQHGRAPRFPEGRWKVLLFAEPITAHHN